MSIPGRMPAKDQKPLPEATFLKSMRSAKYGTWHYDKSFPGIAYRLLSETDQAKTKTHLCNALCCSMPTLNKWMANFPDFKEAVEAGLHAGEEKWRQKIADHAWSPTSEVNNGLIKMLSGNVYGIREETEPIIIQNTVITDPEALLKDRGIPLPDINVADFDEIDDIEETPENDDFLPEQPDPEESE